MTLSIAQSKTNQCHTGLKQSHLCIRSGVVEAGTEIREKQSATAEQDHHGASVNSIITPLLQSQPGTEAALGLWRLHPRTTIPSHDYTTVHVITLEQMAHWSVCPWTHPGPELKAKLHQLILVYRAPLLIPFHSFHLPGSENSGQPFPALPGLPPSFLEDELWLPWDL